MDHIFRIPAAIVSRDYVSQICERCSKLDNTDLWALQFLV